MRKTFDPIQKIDFKDSKVVAVEKTEHTFLVKIPSALEEGKAQLLLFWPAKQRPPWIREKRPIIL